MKKPRKKIWRREFFSAISYGLGHKLKDTSHVINGYLNFYQKNAAIISNIYLKLVLASKILGILIIAFVGGIFFIRGYKKIPLETYIKGTEPKLTCITTPTPTPEPTE